MTIPRERFRTLRWARDWLKSVVLDPMVPPHARAEAKALLQAYPSDEFLRNAISEQVVPKDSFETLGEVSRWIYAFSHPTSNPAELQAVLRHMPTPADIANQAYLYDRAGSLPDRYPHLCFADWLEPDEDYIHAFVIGWHEDCAIAVGIEWLNRSDIEIEGASPWYLITSSTSGVNYKSLKLRQPVLCTVPRSWDAGDREWKHVKSCDASQGIPLA